MKTNFRTTVLLINLLLAFTGFSSTATPPSLFGIHVVISSKSYWDGPTKSCLPREKGGCCHIWTEGMLTGPGEISGEVAAVKGKVIQLTVSRGKGMNQETYKNYFANGQFNLDGPITFDPDILSRLGVDGRYVVPSGTYPFTVSGDLITITFK